MRRACLQTPCIAILCRRCRRKFWVQLLQEFTGPNLLCILDRELLSLDLTRSEPINGDDMTCMAKLSDMLLEDLHFSYSQI